jgi:tight adherence protein B
VGLSSIRRRHRHRPSASAPEAETVLRLAVLLQAGVSPARAWRHLASTGDHAAATVVSALDDGDDLATAVARPGPGWREIAAAWKVATTVGAPLAESLRGMAEVLRDAREAADDVRVALAEPAGTSRLMSWLPLVAVALGAVLGFDTLAVLLTNPFGIGCLVAGLGLILAARRWSARLVSTAMPRDGIPGLRADLLAIALSGGVSLERAASVVADTGIAAAEDGDVDGVLALSRSAGVPAVELLRASAALARHRSRTDARMRAAKLSSRLLLPLGVCTLPAFLLLGVAPMMLSVLTSTVVTL